MLITASPASLLPITGPKGEYVAGHKDLPAPPEPDADKASYYDAEYSGRRIRSRALSAARRRLNRSGADPAAETLTRATDYARQIMLRRCSRRWADPAGGARGVVLRRPGVARSLRATGNRERSHTAIQRVARGAYAEGMRPLIVGSR